MLMTMAMTMAMASCALAKCAKNGKEWQWQRSKALKNFVSLEKRDPADLPSQKGVKCAPVLYC